MSQLTNPKLTTLDVQFRAPMSLMMCRSNKNDHRCAPGWWIRLSMYKVLLQRLLPQVLSHLPTIFRALPSRWRRLVLKNSMGQRCRKSSMSSHISGMMELPRDRHHLGRDTGRKYGVGGSELCNVLCPSCYNSTAVACSYHNGRDACCLGSTEFSIGGASFNFHWSGLHGMPGGRAACAKSRSRSHGSGGISWQGWRRRGVLLIVGKSTHQGGDSIHGGSLKYTMLIHALPHC